jgi:hypothetical protein
MGQMVCPETPVSNNNSRLRNIPEEHRGRSLKSRKIQLLRGWFKNFQAMPVIIGNTWNNYWNAFVLFGLARQPSPPSPNGPGPPHSRGFLDHTQRRITVGRTLLDEWSARRRDLHLATHNTHNRQISMPPVGYESTISAGERPQTYDLDRAATGIGNGMYLIIYFTTEFAKYLWSNFNSFYATQLLSPTTPSTDYTEEHKD